MFSDTEKISEGVGWNYPLSDKSLGFLNEKELNLGFNADFAKSNFNFYINSVAGDLMSPLFLHDA